MCGLDIPSDPAVIVGLERADDAGVYRISDDLALIQTVDFFTPIVDDPFQFGRIAAANALSDVYAMGGEPKTAMNLVGFPLKRMDLSILRKIIEGGLDKLKEAGVALIGGHSVEDDELKYGLSVTGFVHPDKVLTKKALRAGDRLVLTKPLGTGIVNTAIKGGMASNELIDRVSSIMAELNRKAADVMKGFPVHACTDVTGFGLIGHLAEMVLGSGHGVRLEAGQIPVMPEADRIRRDGDGPRRGLQEQGIPAPMTDFSESVDAIMQDILFDPQTSGGLLIAVEGSHAEALVNELKHRGIEAAAVIGETVTEPRERIVVG